MHHLAGKDLLIENIVTAIEICGMQLFLVQKRFSMIKTFWCLPMILLFHKTKQLS